MANAGDFQNAFPVPPEAWLADQLEDLKQGRFTAFMVRREEILDMYTGDDLESSVKAYFRDPERPGGSLYPALEQAPLARQNLLDRFVRRLALVYKQRPDYPIGDAAWPEGYDLLRRWLFFKAAERKAALLGTALLHPLARRGRLDWDFIWYYLPLFGDDPLTPEAVLYPLSTPSADVSGNARLRWAYWDAAQHYIMDTEGTIVEEPFGGREHPYGRLPFVSVHPRPQVDEYFAEGYGGPLADANVAINLALTEMRLGVRLNLLGQPWTSGLPVGDRIKLGLNNVPNLPEQGELHFAAPTANMQAAIEYIRTEYENAAQNLGVQVQWGSSADQPSADSLRVRAIELLERREDDVAVWLQADNEVYDLERAIWPHHLPGELPAHRRVNFAEVAFPKTGAEQRADLAWRFAHGLDNPAALLRREDPDGFADEEAARAFIRENLALTKESAPATLAESGEPAKP